MHKSLINLVMTYWHRVPGGTTLPMGTEYVQVYSDGTAGEYTSPFPEEIHRTTRVYTEKKFSAPLPIIPGTIIYNVYSNTGYHCPVMALTKDILFLGVTKDGSSCDWSPQAIQSFDLNPS